MDSPLICQHITPLIRRHAEDASFYWSQHDQSSTSVHLRLTGLERFSQLLQAHLEGLVVAEAAALEPCFEALQRWKKPAEAFVGAHVAFTVGQQSGLDRLWAIVSQNPDKLLRGVISAIAWLPQTHALYLINSLSTVDTSPVCQVAALRAVALVGTSARAALNRPLQEYLGSNSPHVRAAAWRISAVLDHAAFADVYLGAAIDNESLTARAEAAIATARQFAPNPSHAEQVKNAAEVLSSCVITQSANAAAATGWNRSQSTRRLNRWLKWLAALLPTAHPNIPSLLQALSPEGRLVFIVGHGDPSLLKYVIDQMHNEHTARAAGWAWQTLTGVDLVANGMAMEDEPDPSVPPKITPSGADANLGLCRPLVEAVKRYPLPDLKVGGRYLLGCTITSEHMVVVLGSGTQIQREIAAHHLCRLVSRHGVSLRAAVSHQRSALAQLAAQLNTGVAA